MGDRYSGRPLLRLIECYVLDAIGELEPGEKNRLESTSASISKAVGSEADTWQGAIRDALDLPDDFPDTLRSDWVANREAAAASQHLLTPNEFAIAVADTFVAQDPLVTS